MAMNKQRRTANLNNIVTYDTLKNVTLLADLTIEGLTGAGFVKADANGLLSVDTGAYLPIPSQTGNGGKYLTTDGSNLSWGTVSTSNIYNSDGTLTGNRTVGLGGNKLSIGTATTSFAAGQLELGVSNAGGSFVIHNSNTLGRGSIFYGANSRYMEIGMAGTSLALPVNGGAFIHNPYANLYFTGGGSAQPSTSDVIMSLFRTTKNVVVGGTTDAGFKLDVQGTARVTSKLYVRSASNSTSGDDSFNFIAYGSTRLKVKDTSGGGGQLDITFVDNSTIVLDAQAHLSLAAVNSLSLGAGTGSQTFIGYNGLTDGLTPVRVGIKPWQSFNASAIFEVTSTTSGFLPPRLTSTQRDAISTPATGLSVYNTTTNTNDFYNGTSWVSGGTNIYNSDGTLTGNRTVTQSGNYLNFVGGRVSVYGSAGNEGLFEINSSISNGNASLSFYENPDGTSRQYGSIIRFVGSDNTLRFISKDVTEGEYHRQSFSLSTFKSSLGVGSLHTFGSAIQGVFDVYGTPAANGILGYLRRSGAGDVMLGFSQWGGGAGYAIGSISGGGFGFYNDRWTGGAGTEVARFSTSNNFLIGTASDTGLYKLDVQGTGRFTNKLTVDVSAVNDVAFFRGTEPYITIEASGASNPASIFLKPSTSSQNGTIQNRTGGGLEFYTGATPSLAMTIASNLNVLIGTPTNNGEKLYVYGTTRFENVQTSLTGASNFFGNTVYSVPTVNSGITWGNNNVFINQQGIMNSTFSGDATFQSSNYVSQELSVNRFTFSSASSTITINQAGGGIRAFANQTIHNYIDGTNSATITHYANIIMYGDYASSTAKFTFTNRYGLLINDFQEFGHGHTYTNRWAIYQAGASDNNYFRGKVIIGSSNTVGSSPLNVNGLPTSSSGLSTGDIWNDSGTLKVV
jgi:hypothetical protein